MSIAEDILKLIRIRTTLKWGSCRVRRRSRRWCWCCRRWANTALVWSIAATHFIDVKRSTRRAQLTRNSNVCTKRRFGRVEHTAARADNRLAFAIANGWRGRLAAVQLAVKQRRRHARILITDAFGAACIASLARITAVVSLELWSGSFRLAHDRRY